MRVLYAIQGTGNGHLSRAIELLPSLTSAFEVDVLISGYNCSLEFPYPVKHRFQGLSFSYNKNGGINVFKSIFKSNLSRFIKDILTIDLKSYDLIISDFEPVSAWSSVLRGIPSVACSHQAAFLTKASPRPSRKKIFGELVLRYYAPCKFNIGFHFESYDTNILLPPVRRTVQDGKLRELRHVTVYLPAFGHEQLVRIFNKLPQMNWHIYSKNHPVEELPPHIKFFKPCIEGFAESMSTGTGVMCSAGFETPSEALYLGKKLLVVPIKGQYEQACNAAALSKKGVVVLQELSLNEIHRIRIWLETEHAVRRMEVEGAEAVIERLKSFYLEESQSIQPIPSTL